MWADEFVCANIKKNVWYQFTNHRWVDTDSGIELKRRISRQVVNEYLRLCALVSKKSAEMDDDDIGLVEKEEMSERIEKYEDETKKTEKN